jgi:hypothetical protein
VKSKPQDKFLLVNGKVPINAQTGQLDFVDLTALDPLRHAGTIRAVQQSAPTIFKINLMDYFQASVIGAEFASPEFSGGSPKLSSIVLSTL